MANAKARRASALRIKLTNATSAFKTVMVDFAAVSRKKKTEERGNAIRMVVAIDNPSHLKKLSLTRLS